MGNVSKKLENLRKDQKKMLKIKHSKIEIKMP